MIIEYNGNTRQVSVTVLLCFLFRYLCPEMLLQIHYGKGWRFNTKKSYFSLKFSFAGFLIFLGNWKFPLASSFSFVLLRVQNFPDFWEYCKLIIIICR